MRIYKVKVPVLCFLFLFSVFISAEKKSIDVKLDEDPKFKEMNMPEVDLSVYPKDSEGYIILFNGETLNGWRGYGRSDTPARWIIEKGLLKFDVNNYGDRGDILFAHKLKNFEFVVEWKVSKGGSSGIYYLIREINGFGTKMSAPEMHIADDDNNPDTKQGAGGNRKSGSLYDLIPAKPHNTNPSKKWNKAVIRVENGEVTHIQNGEVVLKYTLWTPQWIDTLQKSKYSEKKWPVAFYLMSNCGGSQHKGYIGFQDEGHDVWFRNIRLKILD
jgi:hypothetical protein